MIDVKLPKYVGPCPCPIPGVLLLPNETDDELFCNNDNAYCCSEILDVGIFSDDGCINADAWLRLADIDCKWLVLLLAKLLLLYGVINCCCCWIFDKFKFAKKKFI